MGDQASSHSFQRGRHRVVTARREATRVGAHVNLASLELAAEPWDLDLRPALDDMQGASPLTQRPVEFTQGAEHEAGAARRREPASEQAAIEAEAGGESIGSVERRRQRRVVAEAQIATKPDDGGGHDWRLTRALFTTAEGDPSVCS